jgi:hypothetical protein
MIIFHKIMNTKKEQGEMPAPYWSHTLAATHVKGTSLETHAVERLDHLLKNPDKYTTHERPAGKSRLPAIESAPAV